MWLRWAPSLTSVVFLVAILLAFDTPPVDVARFFGYGVWAVILPGTLVYRALRRTPHSLVDDLAMGSAVGLALEIVAFVAFSAADLKAALWLWPLAVVLPFAMMPSLRRHWRPRFRCSPPLIWSWTVAGVGVSLVGYLAATFLRSTVPMPAGAAHSYFHDHLFGLALVAEAKNHFPLQSSWTAGEPLLYHWSAFANMAVGSIVSGVDAPVVMFRLALPMLAMLAVVLLAVVGWRVTGRAWAGAIAAALTFAVGEFSSFSMAASPLGGVTGFQAWASQSLLYGQLMTFPLIALIADRLRGDSAPASMGRGAWVLVGLFALTAPGAKATVLPVVLSGLGMVCLIQLLRRRLTPAPWIGASILLAGQLCALMVLYRFAGQGLAIQPLAFLDYYLGGVVRPAWKQVALTLLVVGGYGIYMFARLAGIAFLLRYERRSWGSVEWFLAGGFLGGVAATFLLWHPGLSQNFFIRTGFPFAAVLSALGVLALLRRYPLSAPKLAMLTGGSVLFAFALTGYLSQYSPIPIGLRWYDLLRIYERALYVVAAVAAFVAVLWALGLVRRNIRQVAAVVGLVLVLASGAATMTRDAQQYPDGGGWYHQRVEPQFAEGARWLRDNSPVGAVVATNAHCAAPPPSSCMPVAFRLAAFAERRVLMEGWWYTTKANDKAVREHAITRSSYDPELLARNDAAIFAATEATTRWLRAKGVGWIVVDRRFGRESQSLPRLAKLRWSKENIAIYEVPALP